MQTHTRAPQAPESYDTFWEPVGSDPAPAAAPLAAAVAEPPDAYQQFVDVTEDTPAQRPDQS
jgi:hypothetical protein